MTPRPRRRRALLLVAAVVALGVGGFAAVGTLDEPPITTTDAPIPRSTAAAPSPGSIGGGGLATLVDPTWLQRTAPAAGIPQRALAAYAGTALRVGREDPGCGLDWATLAGIGWVESEHGTVHDGFIDADGQQSPPVVGIALDGRTTARLVDTDDGVLDGDTQWDRAVGPMQFVPSTWRQFAADGNGDGRSDPQQIDDAALAAGRYLCRTGGDLRRSDRWIAAVGAYNASVDYNNRVVAATNTYIQRTS